MLFVVDRSAIKTSPQTQTLERTQSIDKTHAHASMRHGTHIPELQPCCLRKHATFAERKATIRGNLFDFASN